MRHWRLFLSRSAAAHSKRSGLSPRRLSPLFHHITALHSSRPGSRPGAMQTAKSFGCRSVREKELAVLYKDTHARARTQTCVGVACHCNLVCEGGPRPASLSVSRESTPTVGDISLVHHLGSRP